MSKKTWSLAVPSVAVLLGACNVPTSDMVPADESQPTPSVMALMVTEVAPATDTLWGVDNPQSDQDWQALSDAADRTIAAFESTKLGGSGPNDQRWASEAKWRAYSDEVIAAARSAKAAIAARDMDALYDANDALYPPCEACHIDYHPGVQEPFED